MTHHYFAALSRTLLALIVLLSLLAVREASTPPFPRCTEDSVLIGVGNFDNGRWSAYECGPSVDDYER